MTDRKYYTLRVDAKDVPFTRDLVAALQSGAPVDVKSDGGKIPAGQYTVFRRIKSDDAVNIFTITPYVAPAPAWTEVPPIPVPTVADELRALRGEIVELRAAVQSLRGALVAHGAPLRVEFRG